jgi:uncharacterized membrane protein
MPSGERWTDERLDRALGNLLRSGVLLATAMIVFGGVIYLARHGADTPAYGVFRGEPEDLRGVAGIVRAAGRGSGRGLVQLGLLALVSTPVARVVFSVGAFLVRRDRAFVVITLVVLWLLLYGLIGGPL